MAAAGWWLLAALVLAPRLWCDGPRSIGSPSYSADSIVNAADGRSDHLAYNTLASIYGQDLAYNTRALAASDVVDRQLPLSLGGVRVLLGGIFAPLLYVSPTQINFLLPADLGVREIDLTVSRDNLRGPKVRLKLAGTGPALFRLDERTVIATHLDGSLVTPEAPARGGEIVVLYGTGLGPTQPEQVSGRLAATAAILSPGVSFSAALDGVALPRERIWYAGIAPGFVGLYQMNVQLPDDPGKDPEITVSAGGEMSSGGFRLITTGSQ